jgi:predicted nucleic acid-binding protein
MPQIKILLDTNPYLRLAQSLHPLLGISFGRENFTLYIHKEIETELNRSSRLETKFCWIQSEEYKANRKKKLKISKAEQNEIENAYEHIWNFQKDEKLGLSREDIYCIATALEINIALVTDDQSMIKVGKEFDVKVLSTLELLKIMLDNNHIQLEKVFEITEYWKYEKDLPANFHKDLKKLFDNIIIK